MEPLNKPGRITALLLLKNFYDGDAFNVLIRELYDPDQEVSLAAIQASASLGNELAIPHLYRILEHGREAQQLAAIQTLAAINAPSSVEQLVKYYTMFPSPEIRREILLAVNRIAPAQPQVVELNRSVLLDPASGEELGAAAIEGLVEAGRLDLVKPYVLKGSPETQETLFRRLLNAPHPESAAFMTACQPHAGRFSPPVLGCYLGVYLLRTANPRPGFVSESLKAAASGAVASLLRTVNAYAGRIRNPGLIFRTLLRLPYVDPHTEALNDELTVRVLKEVQSQSPHLLNELLSAAATYLETLFGKARRQYLSFEGVKERLPLMMIVLARLLEMYASPDLLQDVQAFFRSEEVLLPKVLVQRIEGYLHFASEEDKRRLELCLPLFVTKDRKLRLQVAATLSRANREWPATLRRLNRMTRVIGVLEIRNSGRKILEILSFARKERIDFLEETSVVTLCQLVNRVAIEQGVAILSADRRSPAALNGYLRGARFLPPKLFITPLLQLLQSPSLPAASRALLVDSLKVMDLHGLKGSLPPLVHALKMSEIEVPLRESIAEILARSGDATLFQPLLAISAEGQTDTRRLAVRALKLLALKVRNLPLDVLTNRLYQYLEDAAEELRVEALLALIGLGDDYAAQVLEDYLQNETAAVRILANLHRPISRDLLRLLLKGIGSDSQAVQDALRTVLPEFCQGPHAEEIRQSLMSALRAGIGGGGPPPGAGAAVQPLTETPARASGAAAGAGLIGHAKQEFKFRRENSQVLTVFFIDIVSYTEKSSAVDASTLIGLIRAFEGMVTPAIQQMRGTVIKKMGDAVLATFKHPFNAAQAALNIQEKIRAYNQYRLDAERFNVRIGLHTGLVIRKDGDIFGDTVNVASRMETSANPGDILLTQDTYEEIREFVRCTRMGDIQVKGKPEPITAYLAEDLLVDVRRFLRPEAGAAAQAPAAPDCAPVAAAEGTPQAGLEPLKESVFRPHFAAPAALAADPTLVQDLQRVFGEISQAAEDLAHDYHEEYLFQRFLQDQWDGMICAWGKPASPRTDAPPRASPRMMARDA